MLVIFKSNTSADLIMLPESGREMLAALGKSAEAAAGIITVEQQPAAIARLRQVLADNMPDIEPSSENDTSGDDPDKSVKLSRRVLPMLEMLERSLKDKVAITWGV
jgi:hypothetical protein